MVQFCTHTAWSRLGCNTLSGCIIPQVALPPGPFKSFLYSLIVVCDVAASSHERATFRADDVTCEVQVNLSPLHSELTQHSLGIVPTTIPA